MSPIDLGIPQISEVTLLGRGGYSTVYLGRHDALGRLVAVKILARVDDADHVAAFERECAAMGRLSDAPHVVVPLSAGFSASGHPYLVMEHYADGSCAELVRIHGPLDQDEFYRWLRQVRDALATAHHHGIVHNDVKPENILLRRRHDRVEFAVSDFGLARFADGGTTRGATAGSLLYVAPELLDGRTPTAASDVYGLAATACYMLRGSAPFEPRPDETWLSVMRRVVSESPPQDLFESLPRPLDAALQRSLAKDPSARPTLDDLRVAASAQHRDRVQAPGPSDADPASPAEPRQLHLPGFALLLVALFIASAAIGWLLR